MSDSSSVDRWHPSNVEWPVGVFSPGSKRVMFGDGRFYDVVPLPAYEALFADRGRVLAAARELAEAVSNLLDGDTYAFDRRPLDAALASFREVDQ